MIHPRQIRAARALLGWSARDLALRAGIHARTVQRLERLHAENGNRLAEPGAPGPRAAATLVQVERTLAEAGITFTNEDGIGVAWRGPEKS